MNLTAQEINDKYLVENQNATVLIEGEVENTIVYTLDEVNKIIKNTKCNDKPITLSDKVFDRR